MSEIILNSDFEDGAPNYTIDDWNNGVNEYPYQYTTNPDYPTAYGYATALKKYDMNQGFSSNDEVLSASLSVYAKWKSMGGTDEDGYVRYVIEIEKPDTSKVTVLDETKATNDLCNVFGTGYPDENYLLQDEDVVAHFDQYGSFKVWLTTWLKGGRCGAWNYDSITSITNVSLNMTVKKYKSVHERIGGSGKLNDVARVKLSEIASLSESFSTQVSPCQFQTASDIVSLVEGTSIFIKRPRTIAESIGLLEALQAVRTQGNIVTTYDISQLTQWSDVAGVTTPWVKISKVIP